MDERMDAIARRQHGIITRRQALELGLTADGIRHRLDSGRWVAAARGVYRFAGAPCTERSRLFTLVAAVGDGVAVCRTSAAALHELPGFRLAPFHCVVRNGVYRRVDGITIHRTKRFEVDSMVVIDAIPVTPIARTLFDLAGCLPIGRAERAVDHALSRGLVQGDEVAATFRRIARRGRAGSAGMRALLEERAIVGYRAPESELERRFATLCLDAGLGRPERQVELGDSDGWIGRVDFLFRAARLVVELDGRAFHGGLSDRRADAVRDGALEHAGFTVLRFTWNDVVGHPHDVVRRVRSALNFAARRVSEHP